jgi:hypothetical protein
MIIFSKSPARRMEANQIPKKTKTKLKKIIRRPAIKRVSQATY